MIPHMGMFHTVSINTRDTDVYIVCVIEVSIRHQIKIEIKKKEGTCMNLDTRTMEGYLRTAAILEFGAGRDGKT